MHHEYAVLERGTGRVMIVESLPLMHDPEAVRAHAVVLGEYLRHMRALAVVDETPWELFGPTKWCRDHADVTGYGAVQRLVGEWGDAGP